MFRPFVFDEIIDTVKMKSVILLFAFHFSHLFFVLFPLVFCHLLKYLSTFHWFHCISLLAITNQTGSIHFTVQFSCSVVSDSLQPHEQKHTRSPCPSSTPRACSNSCPLSWWCHPTISSSVIPFSSCLQSSPASGSLPVSQVFASGGHSPHLNSSQDFLQLGLYPSTDPVRTFQ